MLRRVFTLHEYPALLSTENLIAAVIKKAKMVFSLAQTAHPCAVALMIDQALSQQLLWPGCQKTPQKAVNPKPTQAQAG